MKKKVFIFATICIFSLCTWDVQAINLETAPFYHNNEVDNMPNGFDKIDLQGCLNYGTGPDAIEAGASDDAVYIGFNQSFGYVDISIYNGMGGLVYSTVVNTDVQQVVIIPFNTAASGSYTVELSNANGYAEGEFDHD